MNIRSLSIAVVLEVVSHFAYSGQPQVFVQFGCPACVEAHQVLSGRDDIQYRFVTQPNSNSQTLALKFYCLKERNISYSDALESFLIYQDEQLTPDLIAKTFLKHQITSDRYQNCPDNRKLEQLLDADQIAFKKYNFVGTPAYVFTDEQGREVAYQGKIKSQ